MVRYECLSCAQLREESRADDSDSASDDETNDLTESSKHDVIERKLARQNSELRERDCELKQVRESLREKTSEAEALQRKLSAANRELLQLAQLEQSVEDAQQQRDEADGDANAHPDADGEPTQGDASTQTVLPCTKPHAYLASSIALG